AAPAIAPRRQCAARTVTSPARRVNLGADALASHPRRRQASAPTDKPLSGHPYANVGEENWIQEDVESFEQRSKRMEGEPKPLEKSLQPIARRCDLIANDLNPTTQR